MATDICTQTACACSGTYNTEISANGQTVITQTKNRTYNMMVGSAEITLQSLKRSFSIENHGSSSWSGTAVFDGSGPTPYLCGTNNGSGGASIAENLEIIDTELIYLDHVNGICFWRESTQTCNFTCTAQKMATFRAAYGTFATHWMEVVPIKTRTDRWYLLVNGEKELVETDSQDLGTQPSINILFPLPPSNVGPTGNPDDAPAVFYDYYNDEELRIADGGIDWYYPSWMRSMGIDTTEDVADAATRYESYFMHGIVLPATESMPMTKLPAARPFGGAAVDAVGNILVSFTGKDITVNRLYVKGADGVFQQTNLNTLTPLIMPGAHLKLYPIGVV